MSEQLAREVRDFWLDPGRLSRSTRHSAQAVRERFGALVEQAQGGALTAWTHSPRRSLSLIIVLDQFSRVIYGGTARAYAGDAQALATTLTGLERGADAPLNITEKLFFCMPLQRAESLSVQQDSVALFERWAAAATAAEQPLATAMLRSAQDNHGVIARFGRFPRRNRLLGRHTTPEEHAWLVDRSKPV